MKKSTAMWADHETDYTYKVVYDALNKELLNAGELGDRVRTAQYKITFNTAKATLNNGEPMTMKDVLSADFIRTHGHPDIVVLDPPRAGIHPSVAHVLLECAPKRMVYVSCNPATQARDLAVFADHYDIIHVQPVDMFPHTTHVENVVSLIHKVL